jgi:heavy metal translocating P-type ATPase
VTPAESTSCDLCGLPVLGRPIHDHERDFCCEGCRRVYVTAEEASIAELLTPPEARTRRGRAGADAGSRKAAAAAAAGARRETLRVDGMWCASCGLVLEDALMALPGVLDAEASYSASLVRVTWEPTVTSLEALMERVALLGYRAAPAREVSQVRGDTEELFLRAFVSAVVGMWVMWPTYFVLWPAFATGDFASVQMYEVFTGALALVVLVYGGWPFLAGAWRAARVRRATMDTLVVLGTWTAWLYSAWATATSSGPTYFESAAMIVTIVLVGRWLEAMGTRDATASLAKLAESAEESAWLVRLDGEPNDAERVPLAEVTPGATVLVRAGERVPVDGVVLAGESEIDRSRLTGEPLPAAVAAGDEVWAGTVNLAGLLRVRVERCGAETLAGRLAALAEDAAFAKSHAQRVADAVAAVFVPVVIAIAAAAAFIGLATGVPLAAAVERAVAVLVVSCPCALALATPLAVANAIGAGAEHGLLLRGGPALERAGRIETVAFDKTGTLTGGAPVLAGVLPADLAEQGVARMLALAAAVEAGDPHPVAAAIVAAAVGAAAESADATDAPRTANVERRPGAGLIGEVDGGRVLVGSERLLADEGVALGSALSNAAREVRARGELVVWVAAGGELLGGLRFADAIRPEAVAAIAALHAAGVRTAMVSGDAAVTCQAVAAALGIDEVRAEVLPHEKERVVRDLAETGGALAFVGDGINDAAALGAADVAVAVGGGADVAVLSADVVLAREGSPLSAMPALLKLASATRRVIAENLVWAFTYNVVAIPLAVMGRLSPVAAAAAMAGSSLAVVANSWRLRFAVRSKGEERT